MKFLLHDLSDLMLVSPFLSSRHFLQALIYCCMLWSTNQVLHPLKQLILFTAFVTDISEHFYVAMLTYFLFVSIEEFLFLSLLFIDLKTLPRSCHYRIATSIKFLLFWGIWLVIQLSHKKDEFKSVHPPGRLQVYFYLIWFYRLRNVLCQFQFLLVSSCGSRWKSVKTFQRQRTIFASCHTLCGPYRIWR
jgi:hypothetical protein